MKMQNLHLQKKITVFQANTVPAYKNIMFILKLFLDDKALF